MSMPRTALILAAGRGSRLADIHGAIPKSMVPAGGTPLLHRMLGNLTGLGVDRIIIVTGYREAVIRNGCGTRWDNAAVEYVYNRDWESTNNIVSLLMARKKVTEPFLMLEADLYCERDELARLNGTDMIAVSPYQPHMDGTVVSLDSHGTADRFILKDDPTRPEDLAGLYKTVNIYALSHGTFHGIIVPAMQRLVASGETGVYYEKAMAVAAAAGTLCLEAAFFPPDTWGEVDDPDDLAAAERYFSGPERTQRP